MNLQQNTTTIDAVITWVDGSDPEHIKKRIRYQKKLNTNNCNHLPAGTSDARFTNNDEIKYCIYSIRKYAPWINKIFVLTDNQKPDFLDPKTMENLNIEIVDHKRSFKGHENNLPTFNSISIETTLHRIPHLSDQFIYLNDDFFFINHTSPSDFFIENKPILHGTWKKLEKFGKNRLIASQLLNILMKKIFGIERAMSLLQQMRSAELIGFSTKYFQLPHKPHPIVKSSITNYYKKNPQHFTKNIKYKFRNATQHSPTALAYYIQISKGNHIEAKNSDSLMICFNRDSKKTIEKKINTLKNKTKINFLCIQNLEQANNKIREQLTQTLNKIIFE